MTNAEKFKAVFGVDISEMNLIQWNRKYKKLRLYRATLYDHYHNRVIDEVEVYARNKKEVRQLVSLNMTNMDYCTYTSGRPMYALSIEEV